MNKMVLYLIITAFAIGIGSNFFLKPNNPFEQGSEAFIYLLTGKKTNISGVPEIYENDKKQDDILKENEIKKLQQ